MRLQRLARQGQTAKWRHAPLRSFDFLRTRSPHRTRQSYGLLWNRQEARAWHWDDRLWLSAVWHPSVRRGVVGLALLRSKSASQPVKEAMRRRTVVAVLLLPQ